MFRGSGIGFVIVMVTLVLTACAASAAALDATPVPVSHGNEIGGYVELVDALRAAGATVDPAGKVEQTFFSVGGQVIQLIGADVQVFEYADEKTRQAESEGISADGTTVGVTMLTWVDQPNFWAKGQVIVLYVGKDEAILGLLDHTLGDRITNRTD